MEFLLNCRFKYAYIHFKIRNKYLILIKGRMIQKHSSKIVQSIWIQEQLYMHAQCHCKTAELE